MWPQFYSWFPNTQRNDWSSGKLTGAYKYDHLLSGGSTMFLISCTILVVTLLGVKTLGDHLFGFSRKGRSCLVNILMYYFWIKMQMALCWNSSGRRSLPTTPAKIIHSLPTHSCSKHFSSSLCSFGTLSNTHGVPSFLLRSICTSTVIWKLLT